MDYIVSFQYKDNHNFKFKLDEEKLEGFFDHLGKNQFYWLDENKDKGFWTNMSDIRTVNLQKDKENVIENSNIQFSSCANEKEVGENATENTVC